MVSHMALESHQMGIVEQLQMVYPWDQTSVQMVPQYHLQLLLPPTEWSWVQEYLPTAIVVQLQMARLWDQMSAPMDLLWHLHQQWQPQPALLQLLQMVSHMALESHQMGIVEQLQMVYPWDQTSVQMVPQYHLQLLLPPTEWSWVQEYLPTAIVVQLQMARLWDQMSAPMDLLWHLHQQWQSQPVQLQLPPTKWSWVQEYLPT